MKERANYTVTRETPETGVCVRVIFPSCRYVARLTNAFLFRYPRDVCSSAVTVSWDVCTKSNPELDKLGKRGTNWCEDSLPNAIKVIRVLQFFWIVLRNDGSALMILIASPLFETTWFSLKSQPDKFIRKFRVNIQAAQQSPGARFAGLCSLPITTNYKLQQPIRQKSH